MVRYLTDWPQALNTLQPHELYDFLGDSAIICLEGLRSEPLCVSTLLHGNETSGFLALQKLLSHRRAQLPRSLVIILGNLKAAKYNVRFCSDQKDHNRIWGTEDPFAKEISNFLARRQLFAAIDIHNNTGRNPHYACVSTLDGPTLQLGRLYSRNLVFFREPATTFAVQMSDHTISIVLECGKPTGSAAPYGVEHVASFLHDALRLDHLPPSPPSPQDLNLYRMEITLQIPVDKSVGIGEERADFRLPIDLDQMNFVASDKPRQIGWRSNTSIEMIEKATTPLPKSIYYQGQEIWLDGGWVPSMFTLDCDVIRKDCLGYLMRPFSPSYPGSEISR